MPIGGDQGWRRHAEVSESAHCLARMETSLVVGRCAGGKNGRRRVPFMFQQILAHLSLLAAPVRKARRNLKEKIKRAGGRTRLALAPAQKNGASGSVFVRRRSTVTPPWVCVRRSAEMSLPSNRLRLAPGGEN